MNNDKQHPRYSEWHDDTTAQKYGTPFRAWLAAAYPAERATEAGTPAKATIASPEFNAHMQAVIFTGATDDDERHKEAWQSLVAHIDAALDARAEEARREAEAKQAARIAHLTHERDLARRAVHVALEHHTDAAAQPVAEAAAQADDGERVRAVPWTRETYIEQGWGHLLAAPTAQPTPQARKCELRLCLRADEHATGCTTYDPARYPETRMLAQPTSPDDERAAFRRNFGIEPEQSPFCWKGWQGRAALRQPAAQPTQAGADPAAAATIEDSVFHDLLSYAVSGRISDVQRLVAHIDAAIAAAREEAKAAGRQEGWKQGMDDAIALTKPIAAERDDLRARLASAGAGEVVEMLTDAEIEAVWEELGGMNRWLKDFGYLQFAHALLGKAGAPEDPRADAISIIGTCKRFLEDMHAMPIDWTIKESQTLHASVSEYLAARQDSAAADKGDAR